MDPCLYLQCFTLDRLYINSFAFVVHNSISFSAALFVGEASVWGQVMGAELFEGQVKGRGVI